MQQLLAVFNTSVRELSLLLHRHKWGMPSASGSSSSPEDCGDCSSSAVETPLARIQSIVVRFLQLQVSLMLAGKEQLNMQLAVMDHESGRRLQQPNTELYR
jgi:hypothetical protein